MSRLSEQEWSPEILHSDSREEMTLLLLIIKFGVLAGPRQNPKCRTNAAVSKIFPFNQPPVALHKYQLSF